MATHADWVADGTTAEVPVTSSTPEVPVVVETAAPVTAATTTADSTSAAPVQTGVDAVVPTTQEVQDFIQAQLDGKPFQLPKGVQLPWKRGNETGFASVEEIQSAHMFERDYRAKTAALASERREATTQLAVANARIAAQAAWHEEQNARLQKSFASPEEEARYTAFLTQYRDDPGFKQLIDEARQGRVMRAEHDAVQGIQAQEVLVSETRAIAEAIHHIGAERYPHVDPDRVRQIYASRLQLNQAEISAAAIEQVYQEEAAVVARATQPIQTEIDKLKSQLATLTAATAAAAHNDNTRQNIQRTVHPVAAPSGGTAPNPSPITVALKGTSLAERSREWARQR